MEKIIFDKFYDENQKQLNQVQHGSGEFLEAKTDLLINKKNQSKDSNDLYNKIRTSLGQKSKLEKGIQEDELKRFEKDYPDIFFPFDNHVNSNNGLSGNIYKIEDFSVQYPKLKEHYDEEKKLEEIKVKDLTQDIPEKLGGLKGYLENNKGIIEELKDYEDENNIDVGLQGLVNSIMKQFGSEMGSKTYEGEIITIANVFGRKYMDNYGSQYPKLKEHYDEEKKLEEIKVKDLTQDIPEKLGGLKGYLENNKGIIEELKDYEDENNIDVGLQGLVNSIMKQFGSEMGSKTYEGEIITIANVFGRKYMDNYGSQYPKLKEHYDEEKKLEEIKVKDLTQDIPEKLGGLKGYLENNKGIIEELKDYEDENNIDVGLQGLVNSIMKQFGSEMGSKTYEGEIITIANVFGRKYMSAF